MKSTTSGRRRSTKVRSRQQGTAVKKDYFTAQEIENFRNGLHFRLDEKLGAHPMRYDGKAGTYFAVWAPNARHVSVVGDFNSWDSKAHPLNVRWDSSGLWEGFIPDVSTGAMYKYHIVSNKNGAVGEKADPFAFCSELSPKTASVVYRSKYKWNDRAWMAEQKKKNFTAQPVSIYEVHLGSWCRRGDGEFRTCREMADSLVHYVKEMEFTHVELMPVMEHPFYGSWGYQALSYFAPTARYGAPEDLMYLIDCFHQNGIGVILDWVASHFPPDAHGLAEFDGTTLFEHNGLHPDWQSCEFNLGRHEVIAFLISSALFWLREYHIDGLRVDAVASMLYLDYSRSDGEWQPNIFGGRENLEAVSFIRRLNETVKSAHPGVQVIAEESTAWPHVSKPCSAGGLGFDMKWNMGWMHDTLRYFARDSRDRGKYYDEIAFCLYYAFSENFVLSLSHDEVVYEKSSLIGKMPGTDTQKFASLRALFGYMYGHPGKKLLFMGDEIAQWAEWNHDQSLDWDLLEHDRHQQIRKWVRDLNAFYRNEPGLYEQDFTSQGFEWLDMGHEQTAIFSFLRKGLKPKSDVLVICNFKNRAKHGYTVGIPYGGAWKEVLASNDKQYGGTGTMNAKGLAAVRKPWRVKGFGYSYDPSHRVKDYSVTLNVPPLSVTFLKNE